MNARILWISLFFILFSINNVISQMSHKVNFSINDIIFAKWKGEDTTEYDRVKLKGFQSLQEIGKPELPLKIVRLLIPADQDVGTISVAFVGATEMKGKYNMFPVQPNIPTSDNYIKPKFVKPIKEIYESDDCYPKIAATVINQGYFDGDKHIVMIAVCPIQYYPKSGRIVINTSVELGLRFKSGEMKIIHHGPRSNVSQQKYNQDLRSLIDNPEMINSYSSDYNQAPRPLPKVNNLPFYKYIIITPNSLQSYFEKFVAWKKRKGIDIGVVTSTSICSDHDYDSDPFATYYLTDNAAKIRHYLSIAYQQGTEYALLAGDCCTDVPIRYGCPGFNSWGDLDEYRIPADLYFADFTGDWNYDGDIFTGEPYQDIFTPPQTDRPDYLPEIYVGRLLCSTGQHILNWTDKVIRYEQNPGKGDVSYLTRSYMVEADTMCDMDEAEGVSSHFPASFSHNIDRELPSGSDQNPNFPTGPDVISQMNDCYGIYSFFCHGNPKVVVTKQPGIEGGYPKSFVTFSDSYLTDPTENGNGLDNLTNENYPAIMYSIGCNNAPFDLYNPNNWWPDYGNMAHGFTVNTKFGGPAFLGNTRKGYAGSSDLLYQLFADKIDAGIINLGRAEALSKADHYDIILKYSHNLIGCPEMQMWTATPSIFSGASVQDNGSSITVNAGTSGCNITACGGNNGAQYYFSANDVSSNTFTTSTRPLYITITKQNYLPYTAVTGGTFTTNENWFETMKVLGSVTINSGVTLTISPGAVISFASGASLNINGILSAGGTSSNRITFNRNGTSGTWGGIQFNSGSSGMLSYCNIQNATTGVNCNGYLPSITYCTITNNNTGISVSLNGSSGNYISNNTIQNNTGCGILVNRSTFHCEYNTISYNGSYGINCNNQVSSSYSPILIRNTITNHTYGISCYQCSPYLGLVDLNHQGYPGPGNNVIKQNGTGISAAYGSNIWLGDATIGGSGRNSIFSNTQYGLYALYDGIIYAQNNWWNGTPSVFQQSATVRYSPWLTGGNPNPLIYNAPTDAMSGQANANLMFKISSSDTVKSVLPGDNISVENILSQAMILEFQGKYDEASGLYKQVFSSELNTTLGRYALRKLHEGYLCSNKKTDFNDYVNKSVRTKISKNDELSALLVDFENQELFTNKNYDAMTKNLTGMLKDYKNIEPIYKQALFNLGLIYLNTLNDRSKAKQYFSKLETEFPKDMLVINAHYQLDKDDSLSSNPNLSENISEEKNAADTSQAQILQEDKLLAIYPNPFNPSTVINYQISSVSDVSIKVYDILGREVATLVDGMKEAGYYTTHFDGSKLASGVYFTRFVVKSQDSRTPIVQVMKMLLMK